MWSINAARIISSVVTRLAGLGLVRPVYAALRRPSERPIDQVPVVAQARTNSGERSLVLAVR